LGDQYRKAFDFSEEEEERCMPYTDEVLLQEMQRVSRALERIAHSWLDSCGVKTERKIIRSLGKQIREMRQARGLSQEQLAAEAGIDNSHLGKLERGEGNPTIGLLVHVVSALSGSLKIDIIE
jgi:ribosome-binding protein aMBF1 (putative translation factor)